jgi:tripartite-type tricarboxylate transporter receptor subunit TctC
MRLVSVAVVAGLIAGAFASSPAFAQYPNRPIRMVIPFPAGGGPVGVSVRVVQMIHTSLGHQIVADNRPGADGLIAADIALKAAPDGYTLFFGTNTAMSALPHMRKVVPFDPVTAFAPVAMIGRYTFFLYTHPSLPVKSVAELIAHARANPGKLTYASGNSTALTMMAQFALANRLDMVNVNYKGDVAAVADMASGRVQLMFGSTSIMPLAKEGRVRALAVMQNARSPLLPDAIPAHEAGLGQVTIRPWGGVFAPAKTPSAVIDRLNREINAAMTRRDARELFDAGGIEPEAMTPEQLGVHVKAQLEVWGKVMRAAGIEPI